MRIIGLFLAITGLWPWQPGTMAMTSDEFLQIHKRTVDNLAPLYRSDDSSSSNSSGLAIPHEYIVLFRPGWTHDQHWAAVGGKDAVVDGRDPRFKTARFGYRATIVNDQLMDRIRADPGVLLVENNHHVELVEPVEEHDHHPGDGGDGDDDATLERQKLHRLRKREYTEEHRSDAPWGLQMLSAGDKLKTPIQNDGRYDFVFEAGKGVQVYVLDTGIRITHERFQGRARNFRGLASTDRSPYCNDGDAHATMDDGRGHGTHVAGTIAAQKYGVAPYADVINVKVLCGDKGGGDKFQILRAVDAVTFEHLDNKNKHGETWKFRGSVINMSLSGQGKSPAEVFTYIRAKQAGITVFAAAGNKHIDASDRTPCAYPEVRCVGAVNSSYHFDVSYSNYGGVVEYLAPGTKVVSLGIRSDTDLAEKTGTSMATPHAAGAAAIFISWQGLISDNSNPNGYVYWNSLDNLISNVPSGTGKLLINTGLHSSKKFPKEPFRWAGDYPVKNHEVDYLVSINQDGSGTPAAGEALTGDDLLPEYRVMGSSDVPRLDDGPAPTVVEFDDLPDITGDPGSATPSATSTPGSGGGGGQQVALASYIHPVSGSADWDRIYALDKAKVTLLVANVLNGPDNMENTAWTAVMKSARASGKKVIGYVRTGYLGVPPDGEFVFKTRLGSRALADWVAQIEEDIEMWYKLYPGLIDGIFFDEGWNHCGPNDQGTLYSDTYDFINTNLKRRHEGAYSVLNPGDRMPECFKNSADTLLTFESNYTNYLGGLFQPLGWNPSDPRKIWHIVYQVPQSELATVADLAWKRGAGLIELVNNSLPNPYNKLPPADYMKALLDVVPGGSLEAEKRPLPSSTGKSPPANNPDGLDITAIDYTSASLKWYASGVSFEVRVNGVSLYKFPGTMTEATIGGLIPATSYTFQVYALGDVDEVWLMSQTASKSTLSLPAGSTISKYSATVSGDKTVIKADILIPYAFVRIFFWDKARCNFEGDPAYPITFNYTTGQYVCAKYMVENQRLFYYSGGPRKKPTDNIDWAWTPVDWNEAKVPLKSTAYTNEWTVPLAIPKFYSKKFVIQAEGYNKATAAIVPSLDQFDCQGSSQCKLNLNMEKWCDEAANGLVRNDAITYGTL
jgi:hypothetical protein